MPNFSIINGNLRLLGIQWESSKHALTTNTDNLSIASSFVALIPSAPVELTGINGASMEAMEGSMLWIRNRSSTHAVTLVHDSSSSSAGNRIYTPSGGNFIVGAKKQAFLIYDVDEADLNPGWWVFE